MLLMMIIDGGKYFRLHFICYLLRRNGRVIERKKDVWGILRGLILRPTL